jgi:hemolysin activation/secretion protein
MPPPPAEEAAPLPLERMFVCDIRVTDSTVFSVAALAAVTAPYANRELTMEDVEALRLAMTRLYVDRGYVTSGVIIPDQTVTEGVIMLRVIEGELSRIEVAGNHWFRSGYIHRRLALGAATPMQIAALQQRLQLLQQDERLERLHAELRPSVRLGESELHVQVVERLPFHIALECNNHQAPTVGAERGLMTVAHQNLTGHGDVLSVAFGRSGGTDVQLDAGYTLTLTARDLTVSLRYRHNTTVVVAEQLAPLDIESESETFALTLRRPLYRTLAQELALVLTAERLYNKTLLLGEPFSFSPGVETLVRLDVQLTNEPLLPLEQMAVGGRFSVRGYRENQLVRDNGLIGSLEVRLPVVRTAPWADCLAVATFVDVGHAWNTKGATSDPQTIASIGVGLRWALPVPSRLRLRPQVEVYWGYPLKDVDTAGGNLQDVGLHLQFVTTAL